MLSRQLYKNFAERVHNPLLAFDDLDMIYNKYINFRSTVKCDKPTLTFV